MKRNYYHEALLILDKEYPELKLETFRYIDPPILYKLPEHAHLKALHDRIEKIRDREEHDMSSFRNKLILITLEDVPHQYQQRLLELCKD